MALDILFRNDIKLTDIYFSGEFRNIFGDGQ